MCVHEICIRVCMCAYARDSPSHNNTCKQPDENDNTRSANFSETVQDGDIVTISQPVELGTLSSGIYLFMVFIVL